jgi:hypothetical protein
VEGQQQLVALFVKLFFSEMMSIMSILMHPLVHMIYPVLCTAFFIMDLLQMDTRENIYDLAWTISIVYFLFDLSLELYRRDWLYVGHHVACLSLLLVKLSWDDKETYSTFMHIGLSMEVSNIFLNARPLFASGSIFSLINDVLFAISWFGSRLGFAIPKALWLIVVDKKDGGWPILVGGAIYLLSVLHIYWGYLIIRKIMRKFSKIDIKKEK